MSFIAVMLPFQRPSKLIMPVIIVAMPKLVNFVGLQMLRLVPITIVIVIFRIVLSMKRLAFIVEQHLVTIKF